MQTPGMPQQPSQLSHLDQSQQMMGMGGFTKFGESFQMEGLNQMDI